MIELGHQLGLQVVAEGVETFDVVGVLTTLGCDTVQGFAFTQPLAADEIFTWINDHSSDLRTGVPSI